jgi:hypothetical protein
MLTKYKKHSLLTKSDLPPLHPTLSGHYFSKTGGMSADGTAVINTKGDNAPVVRRLCAKVTALSSITMTDLSGVTITSSSGTSTPSINGNDIEFTAGTISKIELSDGTTLYFERGVYNCSSTGQAVVSWSEIDFNATLENSSGVYSHNLNNGWDKYLSELVLPADSTIYFDANYRVDDGYGNVFTEPQGYGQLGTTDATGDLTVSLERNFELTLTTTSDSESVSIEKVRLSEASEIDWGDGNTTTLNAATNYAPLSHTYASAGSYTAKIKKPSSITDIWIRNNKISGFHSAQLRFADVYDLRCGNLGTTKECIVKSEHMTSWTGYSWLLYLMPSGTYNIDSSDMTSWTGYSWRLSSMPSGTYNIDSSDMTSWTGYYWALHLMPSGTYNIDSSDMTSWTGFTWLLYSMPSGTYNIDSSDMTSWAGYNWLLYSMPSGTYNIGASTIRNWTVNEIITLYDLEDSVSGLNVLATESECIKVIDDIYAGRLTFTGTPVLTLTGSNADITDAGTQTKIDHLRAGDDGVDTFQTWTINVNGY